MVLFLFQHIGGGQAALEQLTFQIRNRPSALTTGALNEAMNGMREGVGGRWKGRASRR